MTLYKNPKVHLSFTPMPDWLIRHEEISSNAKVVYSRLSRFYNEEYQCAYPRQEVLQKELGLKRQAIIRAIAELVEVGLLEKDRRGQGRSNAYRFPVHSWETDGTYSIDDSSLKSRFGTSRSPGNGTTRSPDLGLLKRELVRENLEENKSTPAFTETLSALKRSIAKDSSTKPLRTVGHDPKPKYQDTPEIQKLKGLLRNVFHVIPKEESVGKVQELWFGWQDLPNGTWATFNAFARLWVSKGWKWASFVDACQDRINRGSIDKPQYKPSNGSEPQTGESYIPDYQDLKLPYEE